MDVTATRLHYRYNLFYLIAILSLTIIVLLTVKWGEINDLVKFVSFGLTLTSLFLSLIAIIYTIFSNFTLTNSITLLQTASRDVSDSARSVLSLTQNLDTRIDAIPQLISGVADKIEETHHELLEKLPLALLEQGSDKKPITEARLSKAQVERYVSYCSAAGLGLLYACQIAHSKTAQIEIAELADKTKLTDSGYMYGFLVASTAIGIIDHDQKSDVTLIRQINEYLPNDLNQKALAQYREALGFTESFKNDPVKLEKAVEDFSGKLRLIKEYFPE